VAACSPAHGIDSALVAETPPHPSTALRLASGHVLKINNGWLLSGRRSVDPFTALVSVSSVYFFSDGVVTLSAYQSSTGYSPLRRTNGWTGSPWTVVSN